MVKDFTTGIVTNTVRLFTANKTTEFCNSLWRGNYTACLPKIPFLHRSNQEKLSDSLLYAACLNGETESCGSKAIRSRMINTIRSIKKLEKPEEFECLQNIIEALQQNNDEAVALSYVKNKYCAFAEQEVSREMKSLSGKLPRIKKQTVNNQIKKEKIC
jgi:hypothetical protein